MRVAGIVRDHCAAAFENSPILRQLIANRTQDTIELTNGISVEVRPASFRKLRGPTYVGVICDEVAFWYQDASYANPDVEVLAAVRPGLLTTRGPLILASSAYAKSGALYDMWRRHDYVPTAIPIHWSPTAPREISIRACRRSRSIAPWLRIARVMRPSISASGEATLKASCRSTWSRAVSAISTR